MKNFVDSSGILFILTKVQSLKILQQKVGAVLTKKENFYFDKEGFFDIPTTNGIYQWIVQLKNGVIFNHQFQSPANSQPFDWLKIQIE